METVAKIRGEVWAVPIFEDLLLLVCPEEGQAKLRWLLAIMATGHVAVLEQGAHGLHAALENPVYAHSTISRSRFWIRSLVKALLC